MKTPIKLAMSAMAIAVLAACGSMPSNSQLEQARSDYSIAQSNPQVTTLAPVELRTAGDSLDKANAAYTKREDRAVVDHLAYVAKQQVAIAEQTARQKAAEQAVANANTDRDRVRLEARTREADRAQARADDSLRLSEESRRDARAAQRQSEFSQRSAEESQRQSDASLRNAQASQLQSEASQRSAEASQREARTERQAANDAQVNAQVARQQTENAESRNRNLEAQLRDLEARVTPRGMVITLGDVLFDTNQAQLRSGGLRNVQKLADFFKQYPQRRVAIEGFTDSTGNSGSNQQLSDSRAAAVRLALLDMGVSGERISSRGFGESHPVASNDNAAGRQLNRRVEIIVSDEGGNIIPR